MRNRLVGLVIMLAVVAAVGAQTPAAYKAPRGPDGKPNLNGIWQAMTNANWNIEAHSTEAGPVWQLGASYAVPAGFGIVEGGTIPYKPEALAKRNENYKNRLLQDPEIKCYLPGTPRAMYQGFPFQILQSQKHIMMAFEFAGAVRTIYMADQTPAPADSWMGWSNGKWEGDTLVIDTTGFNGMPWFDRAGNFGSDMLHIVERITPRSAETLSYEATIEDSTVYTRPWKISFPLYKHVEKNAQLMEFRCVEYSEEIIYGHLRKPGLPGPAPLPGAPR
jgi:hypothetical protein